MRFLGVIDIVWSAIGIGVPIVVIGYTTRHTTLPIFFISVACVVFANLIGYVEAMTWATKKHKEIADKITKLADFLRDHGKEETP